MNRNRGFSLVELIVAFAIFAIAGTVVFGFVTYSSKNYSKGNENVKLQYEQQTAVNQIRDVILEASHGISYDDSTKTLYVYSEKTDSSGNTVYPVTKLVYNITEQKIYLAQKTFTTVSGIVLSDITDNKLLAENVSAFSADLSKVKRNKVSFNISFSVNGKEVSVSPIVALRNKVIVSEDTDSIYTGTKTEIKSFIKSVQIKRNGVVFPQNGTDTIGKSTGTVVINYKSVVTVMEESTREYTVIWELDGTYAGISVDETTGRVSVDGSVDDDTTFKLTATSVDDPTKSATITITVTGTGIYPESVELSDPPVKETGNGFWKFKIKPIITYTDGTTTSDVTKLDWKGIDALPDGCAFDFDEENNGILYLTSKANGRSFTILAATKEDGEDGNPVVSNKINIVIGADDIPEYISGPTLKLNVPEVLDRGGKLNPAATWSNATDSNYTYEWTVKPYNPGEGDTSFSAWTASDFQKIKVNDQWHDGKGDIICNTGMQYRNISLTCDSGLNWNKTYKLEVSVKAVNANDSKKVYETKSSIVTINPVAITLYPVEKATVYNTVYMGPVDTVMYWYNKNNQVKTNYRCFRIEKQGLSIGATESLSKYGNLSMYMWFYDIRGIYISSLNENPYYQPNVAFTSNWQNTSMYIYVKASSNFASFNSKPANFLYKVTFWDNSYAYEVPVKFRIENEADGTYTDLDLMTYSFYNKESN